MNRNPRPCAPRVGLEPTTLRLTAACSTIELPRSGTAIAVTVNTRTAGRFLSCRNSSLYNPFKLGAALVAELVDAQHSGCCARTGVEVRVLSRAPWRTVILQGFRTRKKEQVICYPERSWESYGQSAGRDKAAGRHDRGAAVLCGTGPWTRSSPCR